MDNNFDISLYSGKSETSEKYPNRFILEENVYKFLSDKKFPNNLISLENRLFELENLLRKGINVCKISHHRGTATGFYLGGGWLMTNSHVISSDKDVTSAKFIFEYPNKEQIIFEEHARITIYKKLPISDKKKNARSCS